MLLISNAKVNLGLSIVERRKDGFHHLESIFLPIPWNDEIEINISQKTQFSSTGILIDGDPSSNLCMKAYQLLASDFLLSPVHIHLNKQIPIGAGLGGGSSNAAFVLKGLNELFGLNLSIEKLEHYAFQLGSDCAFFIRNKPAFATGKGEILEPIDIHLDGFMVLVNPHIHISTKVAYGVIQPQPTTINLLEWIKKPIHTWQTNIVNDFEEALLPQYSELQQLKDQLMALGASYVSMSGSGSTFYGIFKEEPSLSSFQNYTTKVFKL